jgi:branched-chain amino acid transport system ATP-binding protein
MGNELLVTENLTYSYGNFLAIKNISLSVKQKETLAIIGPNGAGKTTLFNLLTGNLRPKRGRIFLNGREITKIPTHKRIFYGLSRSYQIPNIFPGLDVFENLRIAVQSRSKGNFNFFADADRMTQVIEKTNRIITEIKLENQKGTIGGSLSHGDRRLLEIGLALGTDPQLLLLDEPTAGLSEKETQIVINLINSLSSQYTVIFIEHDIEMVMAVAKNIIVLHQGEMIAEGSPEEIKKNEEVQAIYLGGFE